MDIRDTSRGRSVVELPEIEKFGANSAFELVRSLRPEWLVPRGANSWRESAQGSADFGQPIVVIPGEERILVYMDNARMGGTRQLEEIVLSNVARIEFVEPAAATFRWGAGHAHGVILVTSRPALDSR
jgi:hypothetical protein